MRLSRALVVKVAVAVLFVGVAPLYAQHRAGTHNRGSGSGGHQAAAAPRTAAPRGSGGPAVASGGVYSSPRSGVAVPRSYSYGVSRGDGGYAPSRGFGGFRGGVARGHAFGRSRVVVAPVRFFRPYYVFRPRFSLGFGLFAGFPIAYSYPFYVPYYSPYYYYPPPYPYPYGYGYPGYSYPYPSANYPPYPASSYSQPAYDPPSGFVTAEPAQSQFDTGGVSFEITPATAEVYVDGARVGAVGDFTSSSQPLGLAAGRHHVEIRAPGFETMEFDVDIVAGQVIPYRGEMQRQ